MIRRDFIKYSTTSIVGGVLLAQPGSSWASGTENNKPNNAIYIWCEKENPKGRNLFCNFRRKVVLEAIPTEAFINIFADTSYQLFVNGAFVQFGPVRFDPRFPMYDTHDLTPFLVKGENVIAVQVNHYGCKTYKSIDTQAGFVAWGTIKSSKDSIALSTNTKEWKAKKSAANERFAYKMSFALNPVDFYEQEKDDIGWKKPQFEKENKWANAVALSNQKNWGLQSPRTIPYMDMKPIVADSIINILPLLAVEEWHSFEVPNPAHFDKETSNADYVIFKSYVYSPIDQVIVVGTFYGENWLNGTEIERGYESDKTSMRINQSWNLKKGWNYLYGSVGLYMDVLHHYFAIPINKGIVFSADKNLNGKNKFYRSNILTYNQYKQVVPDSNIAIAESANIANVGGWIEVNNTDHAQSAAREASWDKYESQSIDLSLGQLNGLVFKQAEYAQGATFTIDLGYTRLILPQIEISGVKGATIDIVYSEQLTQDNQHLLINFNYQPADRIMCSEDTIQWLPSTARGARYVQFTFRNIATDVKVNSIHLKSANYPAKEIGAFSSSDKMLNAIWEMGRRTESSNMEDAYVDCCTRERAMYIRDAMIQYHVNLATFGDHKLMGRCLELYGQSPDSTGKIRAVFPSTGDYTIADFSLNVVEGFRTYLDQTGDKKLILNYWNAIMNNLKWFNDMSDERADKLLDAEWHINRKINAHYGGFHGDLGIADGIMSIKGIHCVFSTTYLIALKDAKAMAVKIGKTSDAQKLEKRISFLSNSINQNFWDDKKKSYADNLDKTTYSFHANLFAVRAGIVDEKKLAHIRENVTTDLPGIFVNGYDAGNGVYTTPSYAFYIFDGLYKAGLEDVAEKVMKQGWGWMLYKGLKTCPEYFNFVTSLCHAWSASPTYYLSKYVLGIQYPDPSNTDKVEIKVQTNSVQFAEGKFPHPKGTIDVKWHTENGKRVFDYANAPKGVELKIVS